MKSARSEKTTGIVKACRGSNSTTAKCSSLAESPTGTSSIPRHLRSPLRDVVYMGDDEIDHALKTTRLWQKCRTASPQPEGFALEQDSKIPKPTKRCIDLVQVARCMDRRRIMTESDQKNISGSVMRKVRSISASARPGKTGRLRAPPVRRWRSAECDNQHIGFL